MTLIRNTSFAVVVALFAGACGGSTPPAETTAPPAAEAPAASAAPAESAAPPAPAESAAAPAASAAPPAAPAKPAWKDMSLDQKKEVMKTEVVPKMKALFQEFDAKRFAEVRCVTCHGEGAKDGTFDMPNKGLPKLDPTDGFAKHKKKDSKILQFMMEKVSPEMAKILDLPPYDPAKKEGFGCGNCHTMGK